MKKLYYKVLIFVLTLSIILSCTGIGVFAENTEQVSGNPEISLPDTQNIKAENSYLSYLEANKSSDFALVSVKNDAPFTVSDQTVQFQMEILVDGLYNIGLSYKAADNNNGVFEFGLKLDGEFPFDEAQKLYLPRIYCDEGEKRVDGLGNEFAAKQVPFEDFYYSTANDITKWTNDEYYVYLTAGTHDISVIPVTGSFEVEYFEFGKIEIPKTYQKPTDKDEYYNGKNIVIEGEDAVIKSSYWLAAKTDNSSLDITPNSATKSLANYIGGGNWKNCGETIVWETPELKAGYYQLGFSYRQSSVLGAKVYRSLKIDGVTPFKEAQTVDFAYSYKWEQSFFADKNNDPYLIYLSEGKHQIAMTVVPGEIAEVRDLLKEAIAELSDLYIEITMITGETVDIYRDYDLFAQIGDMQDRLKNISAKLEKASTKLQKITGEKGGSYVSVIDNMTQIVDLMLDNRYTAHRYKESYYSKYTSLASVLYEMSTMPLDIDKICLSPVGRKQPFETESFFSEVWFSIKKFLVSFTQDYNNISGSGNSDETITIWVNWGRDQAQVLNSLVQTSFTAKHKIPVNIQIVNASIVQALLSGKGPDCLLQHSRSEPVNLAMRGVLYDLKSFGDLDEALERFQPGAERPYYYKDGLYALPDTQSFYLMYYRTDIFEEMGLKVPQTWEDFEEVVKLLARNNLTAWMPNNTVTDVNQANIGIGSINLFPTLLLQKGLEIYAEDGKSTNLSSSQVTVTFNEWTDFYTKLKLPRTLDFYNRFRTGTCPIGISNHTLYTTLKAAAPEIDGLWNVALIPGTVREDGTICNVSSGGGSSCSILNITKNPKGAWEFLKWWTDAETQLAYSNEVESILGPTGRVSVSNIEAFSNMEWDSQMRETILTAMNQIEEIPEYPGSYYVSRSVYQGFWNVVENNQNPKEMLIKYAEEADKEIARKWKQYENR